MKEHNENQNYYCVIATSYLYYVLIGYIHL